MISDVRKLSIEQQEHTPAASHCICKKGKIFQKIWNFAQRPFRRWYKRTVKGSLEVYLLSAYCQNSILASI